MVYREILGKVIFYSTIENEKNLKIMRSNKLYQVFITLIISIEIFYE